MSNRGLWGYIDRSGAIAIEPQFAEAAAFSCGLARVRLEECGPWGFIDVKGRTVGSPRFSDARDFADGMAAVAIDQKWGFINVEGKLAIPPVFEYAYDFSEGFALVSGKKDECFRYINKQGEPAIALSKLDAAGSFSEGLARVSFYDSDTYCRYYGYIDRNGEPVIAPRFKEASSFREGVAGVVGAWTNCWGFIDSSGSYVIDNKFPYAGSFHEGMAIAVKNYTPTPRGFIDKSGAFVIEPQFDWVHNFQEGVAWFNRDAKFGFIDKNGKILYKDYLYWLDDLSAGLAGVNVHGRFGFINSAGGIVISPQFEGVSRFSNGLAPFKRVSGATRPQTVAGVNFSGSHQSIPSEIATVSPQFPIGPPSLTDSARIGSLSADVGHVSRMTSLFGIADVIEPYALGDMIGRRYEVFDIHFGGMGVVYGVNDRVSGQRRALKTLQRQFAKDKEMRDLFEQEAMLWIQIGNHPCIARAYDIKLFDDQPWINAEYIVGRPGLGNNLAVLTAKYTITPSGAIMIALRIAQGMQHAVRAVPGMVHRDMKPANILINELLHPKITDFGLAHAAQAYAGTPAYMAPEQWLNQVLSPRTDMYSFGCILYEMLTGTWTFKAKSLADWKSMHLEQSPVDPLELNPAVSAELSGFVMRCLAKNPSGRPASWDEVVAILTEWHRRLTGSGPTGEFRDSRTTSDLLNASLAFFTIGKYHETIDMCDRIIAIDPRIAGAWHNRGLALFEIAKSDPDQCKKALECFNRALDIDPTFVISLMGKLAIYQACDSRGQPQDDTTDYGKKRIECCDAILELHPDNRVALKVKAHELYRRWLFGKSAEVYGRLLALNPDDFESLLEMAGALREAGQLQKAVECFRKILAVDGNNTWASRELTKLEEYLKKPRRDGFLF